MPIVAKPSRPTTPRERFRLFTESLLMEAAQKAMLRSYPNAGALPYRRGGALRAVARVLFVPAFKLTPGPVRRRAMQLFLVRRVARWPTQAGPGARSP